MVLALLVCLAVGAWAVAASAQPRAYVTNFLSDNVSVIDTLTNTIVTTIPVGGGPFGVAVNAARTRAYVGNQFDDSVSVIDTATNTVIATVPVGFFPSASR